MKNLVKREDFVVPQCTKACPAGVDVPRYIRAIHAGKYDEAVAVLRERIPLPVVCADACFAPCEDVCAYKQLGDPIAIRALKKAAVDRAGDVWMKRKKKAKKTGKTVAVVGAGPAGLTAAYYLNGLGHDVTVFDSFPKPGGTMRYGIPKYRLPEDRLDKDIQVIMEGVKFKGNATVGKDVTVEKLKKEFGAVFLSTGANSSARVSIEGADKKGVLWGWEFLRDVALGGTFNFVGDVIVVGGGNVAIDAALTAKRLTDKDVAIVCLEKRDEMPAHQWEIARAEEEGVRIMNSWAPKKVLGAGEVNGLAIMNCVSVFDDQGRFKPVYDEEITSRIKGKHIVLAVGQVPDTRFLEQEKKIKRDNNRILVDEGSLSTGEKGVFAGGDVVSGPASIISAIAFGRRAASEIDKYLGGTGDIEEKLAAPEDHVELTEWAIKVEPRNEMAVLRPQERTVSFQPIEIGLTPEQVKAESGRCLSCDARKFEVVVYPNNCKECGYCIEVCKLGIFVPTKGFNPKGYRPVGVTDSRLCMGCMQCFFSCPDYAISVSQAKG